MIEDEDNDRMTVPVVREELSIEKRVVETEAGMRVVKTVAEREEVVEECLGRDEVTVERVAINRLVETGEIPGQRYDGETLVIPVLEEALVVEKRTVLKEEVRITSRHREVRAPPQRVVLRSEQVSVQPLVTPQSNPSSKQHSQTGNDMQKTLVAVFDSQNEAQQASEALSKAGFSGKARLTAPESNAGQAAGQGGNESLGEKVASFFGFGDEDESTYAEAVRRGGWVVSVDASDDEEVERASAIIETYGPADIEERQAQWRQEGWQPTLGGGAMPNAQSEATIPVVEEEMQIGKREVQRGGIRVIARTLERPVEETVSLREEHATVQRRPADRAVTESDQPFKEQAFEVRGTAEETVVGKSARVVEEVVIGKESTTHDETVKGSVRKTEVDVEQTGSRSAPKPARYGGKERRAASSPRYAGAERRAV